jgi:hypothetical protein
MLLLGSVSYALCKVLVVLLSDLGIPGAPLLHFGHVKAGIRDTKISEFEAMMSQFPMPLDTLQNDGDMWWISSC